MSSRQFEIDKYRAELRLRRAPNCLVSGIGKIRGESGLTELLA